MGLVRQRSVKVLAGCGHIGVTPVEDDVIGVAPDVLLSDIDREPEVVPIPDAVDPYIADLPFPHAPPGPAENACRVLKMLT